VLLLDELERITGGEAFDADFFSNLRALGERPEYRFGYIISSRRPLKELCRDRRIEASSFWNIFGFPQYMGLLDEADAQALVTEPLRRSLPKAQQPDPDGLWAREVAPLAGGHPALIQMILAHRWNAWAGGYGHNRDQIELGLRGYLEDLWFNRHGKEEWRVLIEAANGQDLEPDPMSQELRLRGLLDPHDHPLSPLFARLIPDLMPEGTSFAEAVERLQKGGQGAARLLETLEKIARTGGRLVRAFKGMDPDAGAGKDDGK
jgi:hypothetical protein